MTKKQDSPLLIYDASAGSGKTFTLVKIYLKWMMESKGNVQAFRNMIAMTFTNKASIEMKERIVGALDLLAHPNGREKESIKYAEDLQQDINLSVEELQQRAAQILPEILHHYEDFQVTTIDKFNLRLIRSFAKELNMDHDFQISAEQDLLREQVVDQLLGQVGLEPELTQLVLKYASSQVDEGEKWNIRNKLITLAKEAEKEKNRETVERILKSNLTLDDYFLKRNELASLQKGYSDLHSVFKRVMSLHDLDPEKYHNKSKTTDKLKGLVEDSTFGPQNTDNSKYLPSTFEKLLDPNFDKSLPNDLIEPLLNLQNYFNAHYRDFLRLKKYLSSYIALALMKYIVTEINRIKFDEKLIRISEFNSLIHELLTTESADYIYEKLGNRYSHFLLDEFQDTSLLQWRNMVPLVYEAISKENQHQEKGRALIVGDAKQAIYRFNNGLADQFVSLPKIYNPESDAKINDTSNYFESLGHKEELKNNYRSGRAIVDFNNRFFERLRLSIPEDKRDYYRQVHQTAKSQYDGYIEITSKIQEDKHSLADTIAFITEKISECEKAGFQRGDICILGQKTAYCSTWAKELALKNYQVVSADSLTIKSDAISMAVIHYFEVRNQQRNENKFKQFANWYCRAKAIELTTYLSYFEQFEHAQKKYSKFNTDQFVAHYFGTNNAFFFTYESLYDLAQQAIQLMQFNASENPYLNQLLDIVFNYESMNGPDLQGFLDYVRSNLHKLAVALPESKDSIKIMTIHKSKGLEFPVVILPSLKKSDPKNIEFLVEDKQYTLLTTLTSKSPSEALQALHEQEEIAKTMDANNLFYVAMTRPQERLYIQNVLKKPTGDGFSSEFHAIVTEVWKDQLESNQNGNSFKLKLGTPENKQTKEKYSKSTNFQPQVARDFLWYPEIVLEDYSEIDPEVLSEERRFGNQFHAAISGVNTLEDIEPTVERMLQEGELESVFVPKIRTSISELLNHPAYKALIDETTEILNEQSIIVNEHETLRPDRILVTPNSTVVIDFKTGIPKNRDIKQVGTYKKLLEEMGYPEVQGYIYYVDQQALQHVS